MAGRVTDERRVGLVRCAEGHFASRILLQYRDQLQLQCAEPRAWHWVPLGVFEAIDCRRW